MLNINNKTLKLKKLWKKTTIKCGLNFMQFNNVN